MGNYYSSGLILRKFVLTLLLALATSFLLSAQVNTAKIRLDLSSLSFKACGDANSGLSTVTVQSKQATTTDFEIAFDFPEGVYYQAGTGIITTQVGSGDFSLSEVDISNLNQPVFRLERPGNAPWQINDLVTFTYQKTADCDAVQYSYEGGLFKDAHTIRFNDDEGSQQLSNTDDTVASYNLFRAFLAVDDIVSQTANIGEQVSRNIVVRNSGNGSLERFYHRVRISDNLRQNYSLEFNGTRLTPEISGDTFTYTIDLNAAPFAGQVGNGDNIFENESITLLENLSVSTCTENASVEHTSSWGCRSDALCQISSSKIGNFSIVEDLPQLTTSVQNKPRPAWNSSVTYTYRLRNNAGAGNAYNVQINIGYALDQMVSGPGTNPLTGNNRDTNRQLSNFRFSGGSNFTPSRWTNTLDPDAESGSHYIPEDFFRANPDGTGGLEDLDGDGFFDDLAPGASLNINFDLTLLPSFPGCSLDENLYVKNLSLVADFWSLSNCGSPSPTSREEINRHEIGRESLFEWLNPMEYDNEAIQGQILNLNFVGNFTVTGDSPTCAGTEMLTNDPSTRYIATINLPNGINLHSSADSRYTQMGNQVIFTEPNLASYAQEDSPSQIPVDFPLVLDCNAYDGPTELEIFFTTSYASDCFNVDLHCGIFEITTFCGEECDGTPRTQFFEANRATPGWTDANMDQEVTLDPAVHGTRYYMPKDQMVIRSSSLMNNLTTDNLFFEITYVTNTDDGDISDIITFEAGSITINDLSTGSAETDITVMPTLATVNGNQHTLTFDLSPYRSIISSSYMYGDDLAADEVSLELFFRVKDELPERARLFQFSEFSGLFYSLSPDDIKLNCRERSSRAFFFQNDTEIVPDVEFTTDSCGETWLEITMETNTGTNDRFPNEFRPPILWQSATFDLPQGLVFNDSAFSEGFPLVQPVREDASSLNGGLVYTFSGNTVTVTPGLQFRNHDQEELTNSTIRIPVIPTSALVSSSNYGVSINYLDYGYSEAPETVTRTENRTFNYQVMDFDVDTDFPVVSGNSELASFTVTVSTDSPQLLEYNWLRIAPESDFNVTGAFLIENSVETPLNVVQEVDGFYIEYGSIEAGVGNEKNIRFEGTYGDCSPQTIRVSQNYDCLSYPTSYEGLPFFNEREFILEPVSMAIQLDLLEQPTSTVDMCSDYDILVEVRNAGEGDFLNPTLSLSLFRDINAILVSGIEVEYPRNSGDIQNVSTTIIGNSLVIQLDQHSGINSRNGISGSIAATALDDQIALVRLTLNPQCTYQSNTGITFEANGNSPCGNPEIGDGSRLASDPIIITGAEPPYSANNLVISSPDFDGCNQQTISVETALVDGVTGNNDFARITLPTGVRYVEDSFISTGTLNATYLGTSLFNGQQEIEIALPPGADRNSIISYDIVVESTATICEGNYTVALSSYVTTNNLTCAGQSCGTTEIVTGQAQVEIEISKAVLSQSSFNATAEYVEGSADNFYEVNFGIQNTGSTDLASGVTYNIFCADAAGTKIGSPMYSGTLEQAIAIGASILETVNFRTDEFCGTGGNVLIEFNPGAENCFCEPLLITIPTVPSAFEGILTINDVIVNEDAGTAVLNVGLIGQALNGFTLDYATVPGTAFQNTDYTPITGTLNFSGSDGESLSIEIPIIDDLIMEDTEYFSVMLSNISSDVIGIAGSGSGSVEITDNDITPSPYEERVTIICGDALPDAPTLTFTGGCGNYTVVPNEVRQDAADSEDYMLVRTWIVTDACGNNATFEQIIFVMQPQLEEVAINICIEDAPIDLMDYLPEGEGFDANGTFTENSAGLLLDGNIFDPMVHQLGQYLMEYSSTAGECKYFADFSITVNNDCLPCKLEDILISKTITANGDGINDLFKIIDTEFCDRTFDLMVFNRWGNKVFEAKDYQNDWGGYAPKNALGQSGFLPTGTYYYIISAMGKKTEQLNGYIYIGTQ